MALGLNVTLTVVVLPGVTVIGSVPAEKAKSARLAPEIARLLMTRSAVPVFFSAIGVAALVVPTSRLAKVTLGG